MQCQTNQGTRSKEKKAKGRR